MANDISLAVGNDNEESNVTIAGNTNRALPGEKRKAELGIVGEMLKENVMVEQMEEMVTVLRGAKVKERSSPGGPGVGDNKAGVQWSHEEGYGGGGTYHGYTQRYGRPGVINFVHNCLLFLWRIRF